jgi:hypothetical protein
MLVSVRDFGRNEYGLTNTLNPLVGISAACASLVNVTATVGCTGMFHLYTHILIKKIYIFFYNFFF